MIAIYIYIEREREREILVYKNSILSLTFKKFFFIYLLYFWLHQVFLALRGLSPVAEVGTLLFTVVTSLAAEHRLYSTGSVVVVPWLSYFVACGIFPDKASPPVPVPTLAGRFLLTAPPGKSFRSLTFQFYTCVLEKVFCIETFICPIIPLWMCAFGSFPTLGKFSAIISVHNLSDPFSLSSAFEIPSILLTCSSRVRSFSENIFIKKKKILVLSSHLPESFYLWTHYLSTPSTSSALQFILHLNYWVLQHQNFCLLMFESFHYFRNCSLCSLFLFLS